MKIAKIILFILGLIANCFHATAENSIKKIFISKIDDHPALNMTMKGIIEGLNTAGYFIEKNIDLHIESAKSNPDKAKQIALRFTNAKSDVIVALGTVAAQAFVQDAITGRIKLIFSSVTDPINSGLVDNLESPNNNISGISNFVPLEPQLKFFKELQPNLKRLGIIYNPKETNSVMIVAKLEILCPQFNLFLVKKTIDETSDIIKTAAALSQSVDAIFISNDNTALGALKQIIEGAAPRRLPIYVSDVDAVELGATAALGPDQYFIGRQTAKMIARVLRGNDINREKVESAEKMELYINKKAAENAGIIIDPKILKRAKKIIYNIKHENQ